MNPQINQPLNQSMQNAEALRDIHLPDAITWWPPAIGWWLLAGTIILSLLFLPKLYRYLTFTSLKKVANTAFNDIIMSFKVHSNTTQLTQDISKLLRQISMSYLPREASAHLTGDNWITSLNSLTTEDYFNDDISQLILSEPYQKNISSDPQALITATQSWIKALPPRASSGPSSKRPRT